MLRLMLLMLLLPGIAVGELGYRIGNWTYDRWPRQIDRVLDLLPV
jgi:hypothetical protein